MGKDLFQYKGIKPLLAVVTIITALQGVAIILQAKYLAGTVTSLFYNGKNAGFEKLLLFFVIAFVARYILGLLKERLVTDYAEKTSSSIRKEALSKLFRLGPRYAKREGTGRLVTLVMEGTDQLRDYLELFVPKMVASLIIPALVFFYVLSLDLRSAVILAAAVPVLIVFMILLGMLAKAKADRQWASYRILSNHFVDSLRGLETLKFLGLGKKHETSIAGVSRDYQKATMGTLKFAFLSSFALDFFTALSVAIVAVFLGFGLIEGIETLGPALTILILAPEYFLPIREVGSDYHATLNGQEAGRSLREILDAPELEEASGLQLSPWSAADILEISHLHAGDSDHGPILKDLSMRITGKKKIGIVGESGAGKSTLIDFLGGFIGGEGEAVTVNGQKASHLHHPSWQKQLLYIPQHPYVFYDTLANNIRFYQPEASIAAVEEAARKAGLGALVDELEAGLETKIGESGRELSGGQAQRVAVARAFLEDRPVMLLDEPTAHLDIETELDIKEKLLQLFEGKLVILATHRLHWMKHMDEVIVLDQGRIVEQGTHEQLMAQKGKYFELQQIQGGKIV